jgi:hypothetical protein
MISFGNDSIAFACEVWLEILQPVVKFKLQDLCNFRSG